MSANNSGYAYSNTKTLFAIVKVGQILFIFCARDHAAFLLNAGTIFSR